MKIVECPRDAMQGLQEFIPTNVKIEYINLLLKVGFDAIDFGSFVSHSVVPQMKDTAQVLDRLDISNSGTKLLAIVANERGAEEAIGYDAVQYLGFPLSISETFQVRNTNKTIVEALNTLENIQNLCTRKGRTLVTYISMGFGNPYGDPYDVGIVQQFSGILAALEISIISLADTIGASDENNISFLFKELSSEFPAIEFGAHLHSHSESAHSKIEAAYKAGCRRFDGAIKGYGGCPMAKDELVGNIATEKIIQMSRDQNEETGIDSEVMEECILKAAAIFP